MVSNLTQDVLLFITKYRLNQEEPHDPANLSESYIKGRNSVMDSVLSLDDGSWPISGEGSYSLSKNTTKEELSQLNIRQPSIPPVYAQVQSEPCSLSPSKVADPRPGLPKLPQEGDSTAYQKLHIVRLIILPSLAWTLRENEFIVCVLDHLKAQ